MRPALRALVAGGLGFAVSLIAACGGGSHLLSADQAGALSAQLNRLQRDVNAGSCTGVQAGLSQLSTEIANVSNDTARANLTEGFDTLQSQASAECPVSTPQTTPTTKTATTTTHTKTQTTPTVTTQTQTTTSTAPATTTSPSGTTTSPGPGSGGAGFGPGNSSGAPGHGGNGNGNGN